MRFLLQPVRLLRSLAWLVCACLTGASAAAETITPAFYYGALPFPQALQAFNTWIIEPEQIKEPGLVMASQSTLFAYVSVGEVQPGRPYFDKFPKAWLKGRNKAWSSQVIDQSTAEWPAFFVDELIAPLWQQGYRNFFLDTLDSYHLIAATPEARHKQERGIIAAIRLLKTRYPDAGLILNRGFEILPEVAPLVRAVAAESLFQGWDNSKQRYVPVNANDRAWLKNQLVRVRDTFHLPVIVIDYAEAGDPARHDLAARIEAEGFIPWVSDGALAGMGVGAAAAAPVTQAAPAAAIPTTSPRKILMLHDIAPTDLPLKFNVLHRHAAMPLNFLGYVPEYRNVRDGLPEGRLAGRYAGIVSWFGNDVLPNRSAYRKWLLKQVGDGIPVAVLGRFGFDLDSEAGQRLGLASAPRPAVGGIKVLARKPTAAYEIEPHPESAEFSPLSASDQADVWLKLGDNQGTQDAVAITPWGGYALTGFVTVGLPASEQSRWVIDPFAFFARALKLPDMPVPDVTTENGRRLLLVHMDGDGFASRAEFPGSPWAAEVLYREILARYPIPTTVSVIEGETGKEGQYPQLSTSLEPIARRMFALPHVEAASHSYSHPFYWQKLPGENGEAGSYNMPIPGYRFNNTREIDGSVKYVDSLLPPGKRCKVFLWTGDCNPGESQLATLEANGLLGMNGGETSISKNNATLTAVSPLGLPLGDFFQVYAPNQNENVYTNLWTGPFYGYERAIETFELTDTPRRLKPVNIYYHAYSASKPASLKALKKVYDWAQRQPLLPLHASDYIRKVLDFNTMTIAREGEGWHISGGEAVRTLRIPATMGYPDLARSEDVLGWRDAGDARYIHLGGATTSTLVLTAQPGSQPRLDRANARITRQSNAWRFDGAAPLQAEFAAATRCTFRVNGKPVATQPQPGGRLLLTHPARSGILEMHCGQ